MQTRTRVSRSGCGDFDLLVSLAVIAAVGYLLIGVPHLPLAKWLYGLVARVYGIEG